MENKPAIKKSYPHAKTGQRLAWVRNFSTPNKQSFARMMGADQSAWSKYEAGEREIPIRIADELAKKMKITLDFLYRGVAEGLPEVWLKRLLEDEHGSDLLEPIDRATRTDI
jgi:transcriptional regulator with XRE-family HTH domain